MSLYRVTLTMPLNATITVEADGPTEAEDLALEMAPTGLCHHCSERWNETDPDVITELTEESSDER
ncbi:hypothetical protein [Rhodococcus sp. SJ-2]